MSNWFTQSQRDFLKVPITDVVRNENLTPEEKIILIVIASFDPSHPSIETICKKSGLGRTAVIKWLKSLRDQKVIDRVRGNSHGHSNEYTIYPTSQWKLRTISDKNGRKRQGSQSRQNKSAIQTSSSPQITTPNISINNNINSTGSESVPPTSEHVSNDIGNQLNKNESNQAEVRNADQSDTTFKVAMSELRPLYDECKILYGRIEAGEWNLVQKYEDLRRKVILKEEQAKSLCPWPYFPPLRIPPSLTQAL